jgi:hypothetical protein
MKVDFFVFFSVWSARGRILYTGHQGLHQYRSGLTFSSNKKAFGSKSIQNCQQSGGSGLVLALDWVG